MQDRDSETGGCLLTILGLIFILALLGMIPWKIFIAFLGFILILTVLGFLFPFLLVILGLIINFFNKNKDE